MFRKIPLLVLLLILLLVPLSLMTAQDGDDGTLIGILIPTTDNDFAAGVSEGALAAAEALGINVVVLASEGDVAVEAENLATLIEQGIDALLITPTDAVESLATIAAANEAGIPVFILGDTFSVAEAEIDVVSTIGFDNSDAGETAAEILCTNLENTGSVIEVVNLADINAELRSAGFNAYMAESCSDITLISVDVTDLEARAVVGALRDAFSENDINGIFANNDMDALLAMQATIRARLVGVTLIGFNATTDTLGAVQLGRITGIMSPAGSELGSTGVETANAYLTGEEIESNVFTDIFFINADEMVAVRGRCTSDCGDD